MADDVFGKFLAPFVALSRQFMTAMSNFWAWLNTPFKNPVQSILGGLGNILAGREWDYGLVGMPPIQWLLETGLPLIIGIAIVKFFLDVLPFN